MGRCRRPGDAVPAELAPTVGVPFRCLDLTGPDWPDPAPVFVKPRRRGHSDEVPHRPRTLFAAASDPLAADGTSPYADHRHALDYGVVEKIIKG